MMMMRRAQNFPRDGDPRGYKKFRLLRRFLHDNLTIKFNEDSFVEEIQRRATICMVIQSGVLIYAADHREANRVCWLVTSVEHRSEVLHSSGAPLEGRLEKRAVKKHLNASVNN